MYKLQKQQKEKQLTILTQAKSNHPTFFYLGLAYNTHEIGLPKVCKKRDQEE